jgi:hypothetical protein
VDTVFDVFESVPYQFLEVSRGGVYGNRITATHDAYGVYKRRNEKIQVNNQELRQSAATLHIHPDEPFIANITVDGKILFVGNGIRVDGVDYEIVGDTGGDNYDEGKREHYTLTLQNADYSEYTEESS